MRSDNAWSSAAACGLSAEACIARREARDMGAVVGFTFEVEEEAGIDGGVDDVEVER